MFIILLLILNVNLFRHKRIVLNTVYFVLVLKSWITEKPASCARILVHISELLSAQKADGLCALRSGPASNSEWLTALNLLRNGDTQRGIERLLELRECWSGNTIRRIRAARYLETAAQILVMQAIQEQENPRV